MMDEIKTLKNYTKKKGLTCNKVLMHFKDQFNVTEQIH